jgi:hypothetical protein
MMYVMFLGGIFTEPFFLHLTRVIKYEVLTSRHEIEQIMYSRHLKTGIDCR